jgi:predicted nuclease of predicted toxin-antitoxin system
LRFLLDVHISASIARALVSAGHLIVRAALDYPQWTNEALLKLAVDEQRVIVTEDSDFTDLIFAEGHAPPPSLIYIRCDPEEQPQMASRILEILDDERLAGHIVVISPPHSRFRAFPKTELPNDRL